MMKNSKLSVQFQIIIFSFSLITSCQGQIETERSASDEKEPAIEQTTKQKYTDPLFFIEGQLCQHVRKLFQDKTGNLWIGTNVYDLMRYNGDSLERFTEKDGIGGGRITGIVEDKSGNVWFSTYSGLTKYDGHSFTNFRENDDPFPNEIWSLTIDSKDEFWIGTLDGLRKFDNGTFTTFPIPKAQVKDTTTILDYDRVTSILEDKNGTMWFGTDGFGICRYDGKSFDHFTKENGLPDNNIGSLYEDRKGNIWIGTMFGGVSMFREGVFTNFTENGIISGIEISSFYEDKAGNIWFAVENNGVYKYDGETFTNFYKNANLPTNGILCMIEDKEGRFWFGGWGGLFRFDGKDFFPVTEDGPWN